MLAFGGHQGGIRRSRSTWLLLALLATTPACGEDFGSDPPPGPSEETWSRSFGDASTQRVNAVAVDAMGAVFVTGSFSGTTDFGGGPLDAAGNDTDLFVAKYDTNGDHLWSRRFGDSSRQSGLAIAVGSGGEIVVAGSFAGAIDLGSEFLQSTDGSDIFVLVLEPDGSPRYGRSHVGLGTDVPTAVAVDPAGNIVLGGYFDGDVAFGGDLLFAVGEDDIFLAKFLPSGDHVWSYAFGELGNDRVAAVSVDSGGNVAKTGTLSGGPVDFGGGPLDPGGGIDLSDDVFVDVVAPDGAHRWSRRFGDAQAQRGHGVAFASNDDVLIVGEFGGTIDFGGDSRTSTGGTDAYLARLDGNGDPVYSNGFGVTGNQSARCVAVGPSAEIFVAGVFNGAVTFGGAELQAEGEGPNDVFVARLDSGGAHRGSVSFGDAFEQSVSGLATDALSHAILVGNFNGTIDLGFGPHGTADDMDENPFIAKLEL
ncbi:MAG: hypothetical protein RIF41_32715 [Polyangiaceae bacterium]